MINKETEVNCKGCILYKVCRIFQYDRECPCSICLVKGICQRDCTEFVKFKGPNSKWK
jgi:hypothetical protein